MRIEYGFLRWCQRIPVGHEPDPLPVAHKVSGRAYFIVSPFVIFGSPAQQLCDLFLVGALGNQAYMASGNLSIAVESAMSLARNPLHRSVPVRRPNDDMVVHLFLLDEGLTTVQPSSSLEAPNMARSRSLQTFSNSMNHAISILHGPHHVAKKSSRATFPM